MDKFGNKTLQLLAENKEIFDTKDEINVGFENTLSELFRNPVFLGFLYTWSVFEEKVTDRIFTVRKAEVKITSIDNFANKLDFNQELNHFVSRYQSHKSLVYSLFNSNESESEVFLEKIEKKDKNIYDNLSLMLTIVFRYRNNMFHGNKSVNEWNLYTKEFYMCISFMIKVLNIVIAEKAVKQP
ncbi:hypothetical protein [Anaerorhabdus sp.]|uniref:hypothetical protein n=1 Tax=Anaerorhabdus sp. TaxID=1872524 RepID=UPI002FCC63B5